MKLSFPLPPHHEACGFDENSGRLTQPHNHTYQQVTHLIKLSSTERHKQQQARPTKKMPTTRNIPCFMVKYMGIPCSFPACPCPFPLLTPTPTPRRTLPVFRLSLQVSCVGFCLRECRVGCCSRQIGATTAMPEKHVSRSLMRADVCVPAAVRGGWCVVALQLLCPASSCRVHDFSFVVMGASWIRVWKRETRVDKGR